MKDEEGLFNCSLRNEEMIFGLWGEQKFKRGFC